MDFLEEVRTKRQKLADVLSDEDYSGIREIVEELYPDRAHFIYELLQNAEDASATEATFALGSHSVSFEHNGRPFSKEDVWGITNIGKGTKKDQEDKIGRFGIGFKAVFAYSETPHIWSPTFSFKISELVLPARISPKSDLGQTTRFEFPFNNPKKIPSDAYAEIEAGLEELTEGTLLFLSHLKCVRWRISQGLPREVTRIQHSENHIEVRQQIGGKTTKSSHFLRFSQPVEGLEKQSISVAFELDRLPNVTAYEPEKPLARQLRIVPANPGTVSVFFPAEKETSGLRFHLHAPFVPELSRASIKDAPPNDPLFKQLAAVVGDSLHRIRELNLLTVELLNVLPNPQDAIPPRYQPIRSAIIEEMNNQPLTPTHSGSHAPAKHLLHAKKSLKDLLSEEDIEFLVDYAERPPQWAIGAPQKNSNADRFLAGLATTEWDVKEFVELIANKATEGTRYISSPPYFVTGPDQEFMSWLSGKPVEWHQELYSLLNTELGAVGGCRRLRSLKIVRLNDGTYSVGSKCFLPSDSVEHDEVLPRVEVGVYTSGKSKTQQQNAKKLLEEIGVREVGEAEQVEAILKQRYTNASFRPRKQDLKRFIALVEKESDKASLFGEYFIFEGKDGKWRKPNGVFLDQPLADTGLSAYYDALGKDGERVALTEDYQDCGIAVRRLVKFAEAVGVQTRLEITTVCCSSNPQWSYLRSVGGDRYTSPINRDYHIPRLKELIAKRSLAISDLVWRTMSSLPPHPNYLQATYQRNQSWGAHYADSQLVHCLRIAEWVPQVNGLFVQPAEASRELLPEGFPFDPGWLWLKAIQFGREVAKRSEEHRQKQAVARELGFADNESLERAKRFAALPPEEQERILAGHEHREPSELPEHEPVNPERRAESVCAQAVDAPERRIEERTRSVSVGREAVKDKAALYLRQQYTNGDGEMICQACKGRLPFKLDDGNDYFEAVEFLSDLKKRHYQNYVALCPNHAAMLQYANGSRHLMQEKFADLAGNELEVVLAQRDTTIYFTKTHIVDLKSVIESEGKRREAEGDLS
jgi:hypothetical protein